MNNMLEFILDNYLNSKQDLEESAEIFIRSIAEESNKAELLIEAVEVLFKNEKYKPLLLRNPQNGFNICYCLTTIGAIGKYLEKTGDTDLFLDHPPIPGIKWTHSIIFEEVLLPRMYEDWFKEHKFFKVNDSSSEVFNMVHISDKNELLALYDELPDSHKEIYYYLLNASNIVQNYIKDYAGGSKYINTAINVMKKMPKNEILFILKGNNFGDMNMLKNLFWIIKQLINSGVNIEPMDIEYPAVQLMIASHILNM